MQKIIITTAALLLIITACRRSSDQTTVSTDAAQEQGLSPDFMNFYMRFHTDSLYQMAHITFPVEGYVPNIGLDSTELQSTQWQQEDWIMHRPLDNSAGNFRQEYQQLNNMVIEYIINDDERMAMERRFSKLGNEWYLIYYMGMNRVSIE